MNGRGRDSDRITILDRLGRPLLRLCGVAFVIVIIVVVVRIANAVVTAFERAAETGVAVPDMSGGMAGILSALAVAIPAIGAFILDQVTRHRERTRQIDRGEAPGPFAGRRPGAPSSQEQSPTGGLVNNHAIEPENQD